MVGPCDLLRERRGCDVRAGCGGLLHAVVLTERCHLGRALLSHTRSRWPRAELRPPAGDEVVADSAPRPEDELASLGPRLVGAERDLLCEWRKRSVNFATDRQPTRPARFSSS